MADKTSNEKTNSKPANAKPGFFKRIAKSFRDMKGEIKKVVWPTKSAIINNTIVVITVCVIVGLAIWLLDFGLSQLVQLVLKSA